MTKFSFILLFAAITQKCLIPYLLMKTVIAHFIVLLLATQVSAQEVSLPETLSSGSAFELVIENIPANKGEIRIAVFDSERSYKEKENPSHAVVLPVDGDSLKWSATDLPYGEYAIAVYHDKNTNGKLDANLLGIPKEAYGFSNNARGRFGPASWKDAHFDVTENTVSIRIKVK